MTSGSSSSFFGRDVFESCHPFPDIIGMSTFLGAMMIKRKVLANTFRRHEETMFHGNLVNHHHSQDKGNDDHRSLIVILLMMITVVRIMMLRHLRAKKERRRQTITGSMKRRRFRGSLSSCAHCVASFPPEGDKLYTIT